jgi:D-alanine-D-alanine ligase
MKIVVLMGGDSPERKISLQTGKAVSEALAGNGHEVEPVEISSVADVMELENLSEADIVFPALHGGQGEDGHLQGLLDVMGIPYALSGAAASALAMDKGSTKRVMRAAGIPTPEWLQITWEANNSSGHPRGHSASDLTVQHILDRAADTLGFPLVIKLNGAGSSVGVEIIQNPTDFENAFLRVVNNQAAHQVEVLLERFIPGRELTATILLGCRLPLLEIRPRQGFYDYDNKYTDGASEYLVPAPVHSPLYEQISADALRIFELVGCRGVARADFRLDGEEYYCLEINTIPGMTENSLVPKAAAAVGISFEALVEDLCVSAVKDS